MNELRYMNLVMTEESRSLWNYLLQKGFFLEAHAGMSVYDFFTTVLKYDDEFIEGTVRTVFLNNSPVDDINASHLKAGDRMALGSAMPGLVGIVMGRDNPFKSFRSDISAEVDDTDESREPILLSLKIFSTLAVQTGRELLERGILIDAGVLDDFLNDKESMIVEAEGSDGEAFLDKLSGMSGSVGVSVVFR